MDIQITEFLPYSPRCKWKDLCNALWKSCQTFQVFMLRQTLLGLTVDPISWCSALCSQHGLALSFSSWIVDTSMKTASGHVIPNFSVSPLRLQREDKMAFFCSFYTCTQMYKHKERFWSINDLILRVRVVCDHESWSAVVRLLYSSLWLVFVVISKHTW